MEDFTKAIQLDIDEVPGGSTLGMTFAGYWRWKAEAYEKLGQFELAIEDFDEVIRQEPQAAVAYDNRGIAYEKLGDESKAEQDFAKAKELGYRP